MSISATSVDDMHAQVPPAAQAEPQACQIVVTSPGSVDMRGLAGLAKAMQKPISLVSKLVYQAPTVLLEAVKEADAGALVESLKELGVEVEARPLEAVLAEDPDRFDLALHITAAEAIPVAVETVARMVGVNPEQAYQMIASPPGLILGDVSTAAMQAVAARLPDGCKLLAAKSGEGPFDLYVPPETPHTAALASVCGEARGVVSLGLDAEGAEAAFAKLPKGTARLIGRGLIPRDLLLVDIEGLAQTGKDWLLSEYGIEDEHYAYLPLALEEGLSFDEAQARVEVAAQAGVSLTAEPAGFDRCAIEVLEAPNLPALQTLLTQSGREGPQRVPAIVARNLPDLDARWLGYQLEQIGAQYIFVEDPS